MVTIDHIGVSVKDPTPLLDLFKLLGVIPFAVKEVQREEYSLRISLLRLGDSLIELIEPTSDSGMIAEAIREKGESIHHLAVRVSDLEKTLHTLKEAGIEPSDGFPRIGAQGSKVAFLKASTLKGTLIELVEPHE